jgi:NADH-quinone oxidoreductase subunit M
MSILFGVRKHRSMTMGGPRAPQTPRGALRPVRFVGALLLALGLLLGIGLGGRAYAQAPAQRGEAAAPPAAHGQIDVHSTNGHVDEPVELAGPDNGLTGVFEIENVGGGPLRVTRVAVRTSPTDPRAPPGVSVALDGGQQVLIPPGEKRVATVKWAPGTARARQLYGHVLVESDSVSPGSAEPGRPAAIGIHAERGYGLGFLGAHILSILTFLPLLGVIAIFIAHLVGYKEDKNLRLFTVVLMTVNLALATWLYARFDPSLTKIDGNDGYQFVEHVVWIRSLNVEYFVGVDGVSISMVFLTALISFVGALASYSVHDQLKGYFAMYCLLVTGMFGVFVSLDLFLFYVFWEVMLLPMYFLIGIWGGPRRQYAAIKFFIYTLAGSVFMLLAFIWFYLNCDPGYLVDGTSVTRVFSIPELSRVAWTAKGLTILGVMAVKIVWIWLFVGFSSRWAPTASSGST